MGKVIPINAESQVAQMKQRNQAIREEEMSIPPLSEDNMHIGHPDFEAFREAEDAAVGDEPPEEPTGDFRPVFFTNRSLLPLECITTFGVSVKVNAGPIGYFGTGLKYALAVLLRNGHKVALRIGETVYNFTTEEGLIRGEHFQLIYMNGERLPFTTNLGKNWEVWQAYRELYSNCMDENGVVTMEDKEQFPAAESTCICVIGIAALHEARAGFILSTQPKYSINSLEIHEPLPGVKAAVFYKGIKVLEMGTKYSYNIKGHLSLTEDRTCSQYAAESAIAAAISRTENTKVLADILGITEDHFRESKLDWNKYLEPSVEFMETARKLTKRPESLNSYYSHQEPNFVGQLSKASLAKPVERRLRKLRDLSKTKPHNTYLCQMTDDYRVLKDDIILGSHLMSNPKRLRFAYMVACLRLEDNRTNTSYNKPSDYELIASQLLNRFNLQERKEK